MRTLSIALCAALITVSACSKPPEAANKADTPNTMKIGSQDAAMAEAITQAKTTLPEFWKLYETRQGSGRTDFAVNARLPAGRAGFELIWVLIAERKDGKVTGMLANEPQAMPERHKGDTITLAESDIVDWGYTKDDRIYGNYATRAILPRLSQAERDGINSQLSPSPTEQAAR